MTNQRKSNFESKLFSFIFVVLVMKLIYLIVTSLIAGDFPSFLIELIVLALVLFAVLYLIRKLFGEEDKGRSRYGETSTIGDEQFNALLEHYEKLTNDFIEKKQYKKAAYIQLKLLQNPYRAAGILKDGHLYNEAALVYLKKCFHKENAAECYELARSYSKSIKLYTELNQHEKVGDLYKKINDTGKAQHHYQIVVDEYVERNQYVKASLLYRKKMNNIPAANKLLLKGWTENKDAVNCANNYLANFKDKAALQKEIHQFKAARTHEGNERQFLEVLTHEYKKDIAPKEEIQEMAYELISKNHKKYGMLSLLNHFVTDDSQLRKDILRHKTKK